MEYCTGRGWLAQPKVGPIFGPAILASTVSEPVNRAYFRYLVWCRIKGDEHRLREVFGDP